MDMHFDLDYIIHNPVLYALTGAALLGIGIFLLATLKMEKQKKKRNMIIGIMTIIFGILMLITAVYIKT